MKQLLILSGKGGTGKTTVATAFIKLLNAKGYADCDVDAPNLHLLMHQNTNKISSNYYGMDKAVIDSEKCISCGLCMEKCRFDAIENESDYKVNPFACEGCSLCEYVCPVNAITMKKDVAGELMLYKSDAVFSTAELKMGSGTSGMLVSEVKKGLRDNLVTDEIVIIDGSPGIGCPVIASITGVDFVLIVSEPSISGISDMKRIIETANHFKTKVAVCINKYDTNIKKAEEIEEYCIQKNIPFVGNIPFDNKAVKAINEGKSIIDEDTISGKAVKDVYFKTISYLSDYDKKLESIL